MSVCAVWKCFPILDHSTDFNCHKVRKAWPVFPKGSLTAGGTQGINLTNPSFLGSEKLPQNSVLQNSSSLVFSTEFLCPLYSSFKERKVSGTSGSKRVKYYGLP